MTAPLRHPVKTAPAQAKTVEALKAATIKAAQEASPLSALVSAEGAILGAPSKVELRHVALREMRNVVPAGLVLWVERRGRRARLRATSSNGKADRNTPFAQWAEREFAQEVRAGAVARRVLDTTEVPFAHMLFAPFPDGSGGVVALGTQSYSDAHAVVMERLTRVTGLAHAQVGAKPKTDKRKIWPVVALGLVGVMCVPVPMTTLAPAEVVAVDGFHVAAPFEGVVERVVVEPYAVVAPGDVLVELETTELRSAADVAGRERGVALARAAVAERTAFRDPAAKADVAVARAEAELAGVRERYALDRLERSVIRAKVGGVAMYGSPEDLEGKPVATGQTLVEIADPERIEVKLRVPLDGGEPLAEGARVRLFLDADPARAVEAELGRASLQATPQDDGQMAFEARAGLEDGARAEHASLRLGARGVAKVYGEPAPLAWWLARKPITALRQMTGL